MYKNRNRNKGVKISLIVALIAVLFGCLVLFASNPFSVANAESRETVDVSEQSQTDNGISAQSAASLAEAWNAAVDESISTGGQVTFTLTDDWTAQPDATYTTSFGSGTGFYNGSLNIPVGADIILDLNGHIINRNLQTIQTNGNLIYVYGALELQDSVGNGKLTGANHAGDGTVYVKGTFTMKSGEISGNTSGCGGGIYIDSESTFTMNGGLIINNTASSNGGGVYMTGDTFIMNGGEISGNKAIWDRTSGIITGGGGAIYVTNGSTFNLYGGTLSNNSARAGGGVYTFGNVNIYDGVIISDNSAIEKGGGVFIGQSSSDRMHGNLEMYGGEIKGNTVTSPLENNDNIQGGGGVYVDGSFIMYNGTISDNSVTRHKQTDVEDGNCYGGGGVFVKGSYVFPGTFEMINGTISGNTSTNAGGGVLVVGSINTFPVFTMDGGTITKNVSTLIEGGLADGGGGVGVAYNAEFIMNGGVISNNQSDRGGGVRGIISASFSIYGGQIFGNTASAFGGGIRADEGSIANFYGGTIGGATAAEANKAQMGGGAYITGHIDHDSWTTFNMYGGTIIGNEVGHESVVGDGGGIYVNGYAIFNMFDGEIIGNTASREGGGIRTVSMLSNKAFVNISGGLIKGNTSPSGGGIFIGYGGICEISGGIITENHALNAGGGIYCLHEFTFTGGQIFNNSAVNTADDLYFRDGTLNISGNPKAKINLHSSSQQINIVGKLTAGCYLEIETSVHNGIVFTNGYGSYMGADDPTNYFGTSGEFIAALNNDEVLFVTASGAFTWEYLKGNVSLGTTSASSHTVPYTGEVYSVKAYYNTTSATVTNVLLLDANGSAVQQIKNAGTYTFSAEVSGSVVANKVFTLIIEQVEVEPEWDDEVLYYTGGLQYPKLTLNGIIGNDKVTPVIYAADAGIDAGNYNVSLTGLTGAAAVNYKIKGGAQTYKSYTIHKAQLVKPVASGNLTYNGAEQTYSVGGYNSLLMSLGGTYAATNAGKYTATVTINDTKNYEWADGTISALNFEWIINKLHVTVTGGIKAEDKYYDGTTAATITATDDLKILGVLDGDLANLGVAIDPDAELPAEFDNANVGWHTVIINGFILTGDAAENYELTSDSWVSFAQIKPAELVISGYTVKDKTYDATFAAEFLKPVLVDGVGFNIVAKNGKINQTDATAEWQRLCDSLIINGYFASAGVGENVAVNGISFTYPAADGKLWSNYIILFDDSTATEVTGKIVARKVVVEINDASATYGQTANLTYAYAAAKADGTAVDGILPQDDLKIELTREDGDTVGKYVISGAAQNAAIAGNYEILWVRVDADGVKYDLDEDDGTTKPVYEITKADLKVAVNPLTVVYGSGVTIDIGDVIFKGFVNGDTADDLTGEVALDTDAERYNDAGLKIYDFAAWDGSTFKYPDVGGYDLLACGYSSDNYEISYVAGSLTVTPKEITVVIDEVKAQFGTLESDLPSLTWKIESGSALLDGHEKSDLGVTLTRATGGLAYGFEEVGRYLISGTAANANYDINFKKNYFVINPFEVDLKWYESADDTETAGVNFTYEYNGKEQTPVAAFLGFIDEETGVAMTFTSLDENPLVVVNGTGKNVGSYKAQAFLTDTENFAFKSNAVKEVEFNVTPLAVEVKWFVKADDEDSISLENNSDGSLAKYEYNLNTVYKPYATAKFLESGVSVFVEGGQTVISVGAPHTATAYIVGSSNYTIKAGTESCKFIIVKTTPDDLLWYYDGEVHTSGALEIVYDGEAHAPYAVAAGVTFSYQITDASGNKKAAAISAGEYTVTATPVNGNVQLTAEQSAFKFKINPKTVTVQWSSNGLYYNGAKQTPQASFTDAHGNTVILNVTLAGTLPTYGLNVGVYKAQTKLADKNYVLSYVDANGATVNVDENGVLEYEFEILAKAITVKWDFENNEFTYNGTAYNDGLVTPELDNPVNGEEPELTYTLLKDGETVSEIKDAGVYTLRVGLKSGVALNKNYTVVNGNYEIVVNKADLKITAKDLSVKTGDVANFTASFDGFQGDDTAASLGVGTYVSGEEEAAVYAVNFLTSAYDPDAAYTQAGYDIVMKDDISKLEEILCNYDIDFTKGRITLTVNYGDIRVTANLTYDGESHKVQAWYYSLNDGDPANEDYWLPLDVVFYTDDTYTAPLLDGDGNPVTTAKEVGKYYIKLESLPENITVDEAKIKRVYEITVRNIVIHINDITTTYGSLTEDNVEGILEGSWDWDNDPLRRPAAGDDLGITLNLYKQLLKISSSDFDAAGYLKVWTDGDYFIKGEWNAEDFRDKYSVTFVGSMTDDGVNGWGMCYVEKATIIFTAGTDENGYSQLIEDLTVAAAVDKKNSAGEYSYIKLQGNEGATVIVYYGQKYSLDLGDKDLIPEPENEQSWSTVRPTFEQLTAEEIAAGLEKADRHYAINFRIEAANHETYYGQWRVEVLGSTLCIKIVFSDKRFEAVYGGTFDDGVPVPEGKELAAYLYENGYIDTNLSTVSAADFAKLSAKVVTDLSINKLGVGEYDIVFEGAESITNGKYVLTYKKQLSDEDATNVGKFAVMPRTLQVEWGETEFAYSGERQFTAPVIVGWSCNADYASDGTYAFTDDKTGETIQIKVTLTGDFIKVGGHGVELEIVDNDNFTFRSGETVKTTKGVLSITGNITSGDPAEVVVNGGMPAWVVGVFAAVAAIAIIVIAVLVVKNRKRDNGDDDGFYEDADVENM